MKCICGGEVRAECPNCGKFVRVEAGKFVPHESPVCTGSHIEYKNCRQSGKVVMQPIIAGAAQ